MTHDEYVARLTTLDDSAADAQAVLRHVASCAVCAQEQRAVDRRLKGSAFPRRSPVPVLVRWAAAAAIVGVLLVGALHRAQKPAQSVARYRIVGDASGVVAYTPEGVVAGSATTLTSGMEASR